MLDLHRCLARLVLVSLDLMLLYFYLRLAAPFRYNFVVNDRG